MFGSNVAHARKVFATNHNPAPYYVFLLLRAQAAGKATQYGSGKVRASAWGAQYAQGYTATHKQCVRAVPNHQYTPCATRAAWVQVTVPVHRTLPNGQRVRKLCTVTNRKQVTVVA